jgi:nucleotide-binding universal stress UspA family protein
MTLLVGHSPIRNDPAPLELAATLARSIGTDLRVVIRVPHRWPTPLSGATDKEYAVWAQELGERGTAEATTCLAACAEGVEVDVVVVPGRSAAAVLHEEAEEFDAGMIVVGSADHGEPGQVVFGSTAERLLHAAETPVAIAPRDYRAPAGGEVVRATCAFRGDEESRSALTRTAEICRDTGAKLRVATFGVQGATMYPPEVLGEKAVLDAYVEQTSKAQDAAVALLPSSGEGVETVVATGRSWAEALGRLDWQDGDVLVVGSSPHGLLSRVFIGTNATRIVRHSPVPVVVVPR